MRQNPHVRICGGPGSATTLVYPTPGRNCALFAALCKLALGGSDDGLLTWARTLNREFSVPPGRC